MDRDYYEDVEEVLAELNSSFNGISEELATELRMRYGLNIYDKREPYFPYVSVIMLILLVFMPVTSWVLLLRMLFIGAAIFIEEWNLAQQYDVSVPDAAAVLRDGIEKHVITEQLVPGDIILLKPGVKIFADCRIVECEDLYIDESEITGHDMVRKQKETIHENEYPLVPEDQINMVFLGSTVISGKGKAVVCQTGMFTELGFKNMVLKGKNLKNT